MTGDRVKLMQRLSRINATIQAQQHFCGRVPDPDTRERADGHLLALVDMRDDLTGVLNRMPQSEQHAG